MNRRYIRWIVLVLVIAAAANHSGFSLILSLSKLSSSPWTVHCGTDRANTRAVTVKACRRAKLSPSVGGQIAKLNILRETREEGDLLLEIGTGIWLRRFNWPERETEAARARARAALLKAEVSQREANRLVKLRDTGAASEEKQTRPLPMRRPSERITKQQKASSDERGPYRRCQANLARTRLIAPFDGVVAEINGELSEFVTPSPIGIPTPPWWRPIDNTCFYTTAPIDEGRCPRKITRHDPPGEPGRLR